MTRDWTFSPRVGHPGLVPHAPVTRSTAAFGAVVVGVALAAAGCSSGGSAQPEQTVTVTHTSQPASPSSSPTPTATSDVKGRAFDLGTVTGVRTVAGTLVVKLDRWTLPGTSDPTLARQGVQVVPHRGDRYTNQNTQKTYDVPVADGAIVVVNTCVADAAGQLGLESAPQSAQSWLAKPDPKNVMIVRYDTAGAITRMDTDPRC